MALEDTLPKPAFSAKENTILMYWEKATEQDLGYIIDGECSPAEDMTAIFEVISKPGAKNMPECAELFNGYNTLMNHYKKIVAAVSLTASQRKTSAFDVCLQAEHRDHAFRIAYPTKKEAFEHYLTADLLDETFARMLGEQPAARITETAAFSTLMERVYSKL